MIPYTYKMVNLDGLDITNIAGQEFSGLYQKIQQAIATSEVVVLYNWYVAEVKIPPTYVDIETGNGYYLINGLIYINSNDTITIPSMYSPTIESLSVSTNGTYAAPPGVDGYSPVVVMVPAPVIQQLNASENGTYQVPSGVDGYGPVVVNVPAPVIQQLNALENGTYQVPSGVDGYGPVVVNVPAPVIQQLNAMENGTYQLPSGVDGYGPVVVNVPIPAPVIQQLNALENGTYQVPSGVDGYGPVVVNVPTGTSQNDILFHFENFENVGKINTTIVDGTGLSISTEQSKFGQKSLKFTNSQGINNVGLFFDLGLSSESNFTLDFWIYPTGLSTSAFQVPLSFDYRSVAFYLKSNGIQFGLAKTSGSWFDIETNSVQISNNAWHHIALVRDGSYFYEFLDGVKVRTVEFGQSDLSKISKMTVGSNTYQSGDRKFEGYLNELRLIKGVSVWTNDFIPPVQPYQ